jgi:hypothetical protein
MNFALVKNENYRTQSSSKIRLSIKLKCEVVTTQSAPPVGETINYSKAQTLF